MVFISNMVCFISGEGGCSSSHSTGCGQVYLAATENTPE